MMSIFRGKDSPALLGWKVQTGHYRDVNTGKIIKRLKDITGPVEDISDQAILL